MLGRLAVTLVVSSFAACLASSRGGCSSLPALATMPFGDIVGVSKSRFEISYGSEFGIRRTPACPANHRPASTHELDGILGTGDIHRIRGSNQGSAGRFPLDVEPSSKLGKDTQVARDSHCGNGTGNKQHIDNRQRVYYTRVQPRPEIHIWRCNSSSQNLNES
ncbi:hypothetical protein BAE29_14440 [Acidithiobacillus caldus]|uniref:Secreted protein n=1 Tax=Acidithiobacillus caldus TaxID=33059 RepID=A0A1E7YMR3_9PROT|nr:hypothetical protein BAE28_11505 [Acidithiobacillus caldus]OFC35625.1 hypothetical protein BAE27_07305 [Acidithiobacillus caldus]OFC35834.1 hypothetical protein BAE29_14440 [Acidithiobacillus caldus]